ncbi:hypothetical protein FWF89_03300 [Candidatus Saccharibacteria bacterium]|nr:hypothetical protein [Candidatus Saccharibacteria bacterium]
MLKNFTSAIKAMPKRLAVLTAAGVMVAIPIANVSAWGDNGGGRPSYTINQINNGILGNTITFNSISNNPNIGDEKSFVGIREKTGVNAGLGNTWYNSMQVQAGKTYLVSMYVHNNSPKGLDAIARDVVATFNVPTTVGRSIEVNGFIDSSNANPSRYWDNAFFTSSQDFYLSYVNGSALFENNGIGANGGVRLSDNIVTNSGVRLGYNSLNGDMPGCFEYAGYVTIEVKPTFVTTDTNLGFLVEKTVRKDGDKEWVESVNANVGDIVNYQIHYRNLGTVNSTNVMVKDILPKNMDYIAGTTVLYNTNNPNGLKISDNITTVGVNIGGYNPNGDAYVRFSAKVVDRDLACGANSLTNWGQIGINGGNNTKQDSAVVNVSKTCTTTPPKLPETGPASVVGAVIGAGSLITAGTYYILSRKKLS